MNKISIFIIMLSLLSGCGNNADIHDARIEDSDFIEIWQVDYKIIAMGYHENFVIKSDNTLWTWGSFSNSLKGGVNTVGDVSVQIMYDVVSVSASRNHTLAIRTDGSLWSWGVNNNGQLGDGTTTSSKIPTRIMDDVVSIAAGNGNSFAVKTDGSLWAWGSNNGSLWVAGDAVRGGVLGDGTVTYRNESGDLVDNDRLTPIKILDGVASVATGNGHSLALKKDRSVWAWGLNNAGAIGDGTMTTYDGWKINENHDRSTPVKVAENMTSIAVSMTTSFAVDANGNLWAWGFNGNGQIGDGTTIDRHIPTKVMSGVSSVFSGGIRTFAVKEDGSLWAWGDNLFGELGDGTTVNRTTPVKIMDDVKFIEVGSVLVSGEFAHESENDVQVAGRVLAVKSDGSLWAWGANLMGELGDVIYSSTPIQIADNIKIP